jgi:hypothetical protein
VRVGHRQALFVFSVLKTENKTKSSVQVRLILVTICWRDG